MLRASSITPRAAVRRCLVAMVTLLLCLSAGASTALAGVANGGLPHASRSNPLAGMPWGVYRGQFYNSIYPNYQQATGRNRSLLGKIALRPLAFTFGDWFSDADARQRRAAVHPGRDRRQSRRAQPDGRVPARSVGGGGLPERLVERGQPAAATAPGSTTSPPGIGSARVALILQPDLAFAECAHSPVPLELVNYAAHRFNALPHTTVYIDGGARYFPSFSQAVSMLEQAGIRNVRGFALNTSEYDTTSSEIEYGARVVHALAAAGIPNKHFVVSTAENGAGFLNGQYPGDVSHPRVCSSPTDHLCVTLGIPPTTKVANPALAPLGRRRRPRVALRRRVRVGGAAVARPRRPARAPARARSRRLDAVLGATR